MRVKTILLALCAVAAASAVPTASAAAVPRANPNDRGGVVLAHVENHPVFGGIRIAPDRTAIEVFVTRRDQGIERSARLAAAGADVRFTVVRNTVAALNRLRARVHADDALLRRNGIRVVSWFTSHSLNRVKLGIVDPTPAKVAFLEGRYGADMVTVVADAPEVPAYSRNDDISPWNGGSVINVRKSTGGSTNCTLGPAMRNSSGTEYLLTAGHCFVDPAGMAYRDVWQEASFRTDDDPTYLGLGFGRVPTPGTSGYDVATIPVNASGLVFRTKHPLDQGSGSPQSGTIRAIENTGVCISGALSGQWCATYVIDFDGETSYEGTGTIVHVNRARRDPQMSTAIAGSGDSGAPVYQVRSDGSLSIAGMFISTPDTAGGWWCPAQDYYPRGYDCANQITFQGIGSLQAYLGMTVLTL